MLDNIKIFTQSSIFINNNKLKLYFDPYQIDSNYNDADIILITHSHYDHFSEADLNKVKNDNTIIVIPNDLLDQTLKLGFDRSNIVLVEPNKTYTIKNIHFETIPAYNILKPFHPKKNGWVGYIFELDNIRYYIAGDTDNTAECQQVKCDIAFIPIGGTYTMDYKEAAELVNIIKPKIAVPIHYGSIVGNKTDGEKFKKLLDSKIECEILLYK